MLFIIRWIDALCDAQWGFANRLLSLPEQRIQGPIPDVLTLKLGVEWGRRKGENRSAVATGRRMRRLVRTSEAEVYARQANASPFAIATATLSP